MSTVDLDFHSTDTSQYSQNNTPLSTRKTPGCSVSRVETVTVGALVLLRDIAESLAEEYSNSMYDLFIGQFASAVKLILMYDNIYCGFCENPYLKFPFRKFCDILL